MLTYTWIFKMFKEAIERYFTKNVMTCNEKVATACLFIMQTEFDRSEKIDIGKWLYENCFYFSINLDFFINEYNENKLVKIIDYIKYEIIKR